LGAPPADEIVSSFSLYSRPCFTSALTITTVREGRGSGLLVVVDVGSDLKLKGCAERAIILQEAGKVE
jgi:hypothetical protein